MPQGVFNPNDPALKGGVQLQRVPVIPWDAFVGCGLQVYKEEKIQPAIFEPNPMETAEEAFQTMRFLLAAQQRKPGPIQWDTVPPEVQRHFKFQPDSPSNPA